MTRNEKIAVVASILLVLGLIAFFPVHHIKSVPAAPTVVTVTPKVVSQPVTAPVVKPIVVKPAKSQPIVVKKVIKHHKHRVIEKVCDVVYRLQPGRV